VNKKSKQLAERLRKIDPKPDEKEIQKIEEKILAKHLEYENALKLRDYEAAYRLRFEMKSLYGKQADAKLRPWKEGDSIIRELTEKNASVVENSSNWLAKEIRDLDFMLDIEVLEKIWNPVNNTHRYRTKNNFAKVREIQGKLLEAKTKIQKLLGSGSIAEIEKIYLDALEKAEPFLTLPRSLTTE